MERAWRIAKEMSNLIVYCRSVAFNLDRIKTKGFIFNEMSSFPETKAEKLMCQQENKFFIKYHQVQQYKIIIDLIFKLKDKNIDNYNFTDSI